MEFIGLSIIHKYDVCGVQDLASNYNNRRETMKTVVLKTVIGLGLFFAVGASFAQDELFGITCPDGWCRCDGGTTKVPQSCCGRNYCDQIGTFCDCG